MNNLYDIINASFEVFGFLAILPSIRQLIKDKETKGIHWSMPAFFTTWGFFNLFFYTHLEQSFSAIGAFMTFSANITWIVLLLYYKYFYKVSK